MPDEVLDQNLNRTMKIMLDSIENLNKIQAQDVTNQTPEVSYTDCSCSHLVFEINCILEGEYSGSTCKICAVSLETYETECRQMI